MIHGRHVFIGYHGMEEETRYVKDSEGWLHTGDMGYLDKVSAFFGVHNSMLHSIYYTGWIPLHLRSH